MKINKILYSIFMIFIYVRPVLADCTDEAIGPQLSFDPPSSLEPLSLEINISPSKVTTKYLIRNTSGHNLVEWLHFYLPEHRWHAPVDWYPDRRFEDLKVFVNGQNISLQKEVKAYLNGLDITNKLKEFKLDPDLAHLYDPDINATQYDMNILNYFKNEGLIWDYYGSIPEDDKISIEPKWGVINHYFWEQKFTQNDIIEIYYSYNPLLGITGINIDEEDLDPCKSDIKYMLNNACLSKSKIKNSIVSDWFYKIYWVTIDLSQIRWKNKIKNFKVSANFFNGATVNDWEMFPESQEGRFLAFCINGEEYFGEPKIEMHHQNIKFKKEIKFLLFDKKPEPAG